MGLLDILGISALKAKRDAAKAEEAGCLADADAALDDCEDAVGALSAGQMRDLKSLYLSAKALCDSLDRADVCAYAGQPNRMLADIFQTDFMRFFLHLAIADGELNPAEAAFMNAVLGCNRTVGEWAIAAIRLEVKSMAHGNEAPFSVRVIHCAGQDVDIDAREVVSPVFRQLGDALILADGQASPEELERLEAYMADIQQALGQPAGEVAPPGYPLAIE